MNDNTLPRIDERLTLEDPRMNHLPQHEHKFVIPVEWYVYAVSNPLGKHPHPEKRQTVTKLRCACGEETDR